MAHTTDTAWNEWMRKVDNAMSSESGLTSDDLPDYYNFWNAYLDGLTPGAAATAALREVGFYSFVAEFEYEEDW
jgi:hypothetical protein